MKGKPSKSKGPARRYAEGGDITSSRTYGESQRHVKRRFAETGGVAGAVNRAVQKFTQSKEKVAEMEKKAAKARKDLGID